MKQTPRTGMKKFIISLLNAYFLNTLYGAIVLEKLERFLGYHMPVKEVRNTGTAVTIKVNDCVIVHFKLNARGYISKIDVEETKK